MQLWKVEKKVGNFQLPGTCFRDIFIVERCQDISFSFQIIQIIQIMIPIYVTKTLLNLKTVDRKGRIMYQQTPVCV